MMGNWGGLGGNLLWLGPIIMILFWILIIVGIVWLVRMAMGKRGSWRGFDNEAERILKERYAKGEIDAKEYDERMKNIR